MPKSKPFGIRKITSSDVSDNLIVGFPKPSETLANPEHFDQRIILPQYSIPGKFIKLEFEGLLFYFMVTPVFLDYADFRLTDDNKYEIVSYSKTPIANFDAKFIDWCEGDMQDNFHGYESEPTYYQADKSVKESGIYIGGEPIWDQGSYEKGDSGKTDYSLDIFKDENGDLMHFIAALYDGEIFGSYNIFYSPKTRLVRQFHQST